MKNFLLPAFTTVLVASQMAFAQNTKKVEETQNQQTLTNQSGQVVQDNNAKSTTTTEEVKSKISKGGFFIEPILFASQEEQSIRTTQLPLITDDTSGTAKGYGAGLRMGGHVSEILLLGLDGRYAKINMEDSFYNSAEAKVYNIAPTIGLQTPLFGIRILGSYVVAGENDPASGIQGLDLKFKEATGWRLGAGLHVFAVSINLEYQDLSYNTTEIESFGSLTANNATDIDMDSKGYALSASFPIEL